MANIGDILNSPEQGWRRVLFSDFDSINFYIYTNYTENYKDFIIQGGVHLYHEDVTVTNFSFSNSPYTTKWRLIGSTIKEEVNLFNLPPDFAYQVNYITPDSEHRLLMEGIFAPEDDDYCGPNFSAEIEYSDTDFVLYAIDFYNGLETEIEFNIDFDKVQLGKFVEIKYSDIKENGVPISNNNIVVKYWSNYDKTPRILNKEGEIFENSIDLYFQIEGEGYETSDIIHKELKIINIDGFQGSYNGGVVGYANHTNDNYKTTEARILIPLTNTSFISYKK